MGASDVMSVMAGPPPVLLVQRQKKGPAAAIQTNTRSPSATPVSPLSPCPRVRHTHSQTHTDMGIKNQMLWIKPAINYVTTM